LTKHNEYLGKKSGTFDISIMVIEEELEGTTEEMNDLYGLIDDNTHLTLVLEYYFNELAKLKALIDVQSIIHKSLFAKFTELCNRFKPVIYIGFSVLILVLAWHWWPTIKLYLSAAVSIDPLAVKTILVMVGGLIFYIILVNYMDRKTIHWNKKTRINGIDSRQDKTEKKSASSPTISLKADGEASPFAIAQDSSAKSPEDTEGSSLDNSRSSSSIENGKVSSPLNSNKGIIETGQLMGVLHDIKNNFVIIGGWAKNLDTLTTSLELDEEQKKPLNEFVTLISIIDSYCRANLKRDKIDLLIDFLNTNFELFLERYEALRKWVELNTREGGLLEKEKDKVEKRMKIIEEEASRVIPAIGQLSFVWLGHSMRPVDIRALFIRVVNRAKESERLKQLYPQFSFELHIEPTIPDLIKNPGKTVFGYGEILSAALEEVIYNAIKYGALKDYHGKKMNKIIIKVFIKDGQLKAEVSNVVKSKLSCKKLKEMFIPYLRGEGSEPIEGSGIGLSSLKTDIEAVCGRINARCTTPNRLMLEFSLPVNAPVDILPAKLPEGFKKSSLLVVFGRLGSGRRVTARALAGVYGLRYINIGFLMRVLFYYFLKEFNIELTTRNIDEYQDEMASYVKKFLGSGRLDFNSEPLLIDRKDSAELDQKGNSIRADIKRKIDSNMKVSKFMHKFAHYERVNELVKRYIIQLAEEIRESEKYNGIIIKSTEPWEEADLNILLHAEAEVRAKRYRRPIDFVKELDIATGEFTFDSAKSRVIIIDSQKRKAFENIEIIRYAINSSPNRTASSPVVNSRKSSKILFNGNFITFPHWVKEKCIFERQGPMRMVISSRDNEVKQLILESQARHITITLKGGKWSKSIKAKIKKPSGYERVFINDYYIFRLFRDSVFEIPKKAKDRSVALMQWLLEYSMKSSMRTCRMPFGSAKIKLLVPHDYCGPKGPIVVYRDILRSARVLALVSKQDPSDFVVFERGNKQNNNRIIEASQQQNLEISSVGNVALEGSCLAFQKFDARLKRKILDRELNRKHKTFSFGGITFSIGAADSKEIIVERKRSHAVTNHQKTDFELILRHRISRRIITKITMVNGNTVISGFENRNGQSIPISAKYIFLNGLIDQFPQYSAEIAGYFSEPQYTNSKRVLYDVVKGKIVRLDDFSNGIFSSRWQINPPFGR